MNKFIFNTLFISVIILGLINFTSCEDDEDVGETVYAEFMVDSTDRNNPIFSSLSVAKDENLTLYHTWSFGNGDYGYDSLATTTYNFPDTVTVSYTVTTSEGISNTATMTYYIYDINTDLKANKYLANLCLNIINTDTTDTREWVLSTAEGHISTGPSAAIESGLTIDYLTDPINETEIYPADYLTTNADSGVYAYDNIMSFTLENFVYNNAGPNKWIANWYFANSEFGYSQELGKDVCLDVTTGLDTAGYYYLIEDEIDNTVFITLSGKNFLLYYEGKPSKTKYQVLGLYDDLLVVRKAYFDESGLPAGYRYLRYVPKGNKDLPNRAISIVSPPYE